VYPQSENTVWNDTFDQLSFSDRKIDDFLVFCARVSVLDRARGNPKERPGDTVQSAKRTRDPACSFVT
jgi:hypothetical protein